MWCGLEVGEGGKDSVVSALELLEGGGSLVEEVGVVLDGGACLGSGFGEFFVGGDEFVDAGAGIGGGEVAQLCGVLGDTCGGVVEGAGEGG